jgi:hypothetical protein
LPAARRGFDDEALPPGIVVDSSFFFEALFDPGTPRNAHIACLRFADRLRTEQVTLLYSTLLFIEAPQAWRRLYRPGVLPTSQHVDSEVAGGSMRSGMPGTPSGDSWSSTTAWRFRSLRLS